MRATGLLVPGSLVRWTYRLRLAGRQRQRRQRRDRGARARNFPTPAGRSARRSNASPALERNIDHFTQFLTLVGLTALLVGGVGVANAVKSHIDRKRDVDRDAEGARRVRRPGVRDLLWQVLLLSAVGAAIGLVARRGLAVRASRRRSAPSFRCRSRRRCIRSSSLLAFFYGLLTALAFALWPLGRAHDVPVSALFRDAVSPGRRWPRRRYVVASALVVAALAAHRDYAVLRPQDRGDFCRRRRRGVRGAAARRDAG